jgi:hypothetical protein
LFPSSSVFLTPVSYPLIAKFIHLFLPPLSYFILIFFFLRTFATVNFGCSYPYATLNLLTPNAHFSSRTAPLTYRCCIFLFIQQIYVQKVLNMLHTLRSFLFKMSFIS